MKKTETPEPMDASIREDATPTAITNHARVCGAVKTLVGEVAALYPEITVEYSNYDGRNTALAVTFDLTSMEGGDSVVFNNLLNLVDSDERVAEVITADYDQSYVAMRSSLRTQDSREPFGLADALLVLNGADEGEDDSLDGDPWDGSL